MTLDDVFPIVMQWTNATAALAALGAEVGIQLSGQEAAPELGSALKAVSTAAGIGDLSELPAPQQAMLLGIIRMSIAQASDLVEHPERPPGWSYTDPAILDGYGRGSSMIPSLIAAAHPDLAAVSSFLDVGTGVGLLAAAAAGVWPSTTVVGIDPYEPSLERARANVAQAGLQDRVVLRRQTLAEVDDVDAFDCVWIPTFFLTEPVLEEGLRVAARAVRPGGWVALGRTRTKPDPLAEATTALGWIRGGGCNIDAKRAVELLEHAGFVDVHIPPAAGQTPLELVLGRRPAA